MSKRASPAGVRSSCLKPGEGCEYMEETVGTSDVLYR